MPNPRIRVTAEAAYLASSQVTFENYNSIIDNSDYFGSLREQKYEFFDVRDNKRDGFYAVALHNCEEMLIALRGTDFYNFNILQMVLSGLCEQEQLAANLTAKIESDDLYSDLQIALGKIPRQYKSAEAFIANLSKLYPGNKMVITGHSLGGLLAQLVAAKFGIETVVFDSPGAKKMIEQLIGQVPDLQKITIINDLPNFINTCGEHIKTPIAVNNGGAISLNVVCNFLGTMPHKPGKKAKYLCSHGMEDILNSIDKDGAYTTIPIKNWPKNSMSFYTSIETYNAMPDIYDAYIYEMWKKSENLFKIKSLAFESYKKCFLKQKLKPY